MIKKNNMVRPEEIGRGTRLRFVNDANLYYAKNVKQMDGVWYVFIIKGDDDSRTYRKTVKSIRQINGKTILNESISFISAILGKG